MALRVSHYSEHIFPQIFTNLCWTLSKPTHEVLFPSSLHFVRSLPPLLMLNVDRRVREPSSSSSCASQQHISHHGGSEAAGDMCAPLLIYLVASLSQEWYTCLFHRKLWILLWDRLSRWIDFEVRLHVECEVFCRIGPQGSANLHSWISEPKRSTSELTVYREFDRYLFKLDLVKFRENKLSSHWSITTCQFDFLLRSRSTQLIRRQSGLSPSGHSGEIRQPTLVFTFKLNIVQGDTSRWSKAPVDIKTKVPF